MSAQAFQEVVAIIDRLLGPNGCEWDRRQTLESLRSCVVEEVYELIEAIDLNDNAMILEELGDLFFNAIFFSRVAEKEGRFAMSDVLKGIAEKLIRRHPHVFGDVKLEELDDVMKQWDRIKNEEKGKVHRKSALDGIPKDLPALSRAQKALKKMLKLKFPLPHQAPEIPPFENEEELGTLLLTIAEQAQIKGLHAEHALRKALSHAEKDFRSFESHSL